MIITFTNYFDQTQSIGFVPILDYYGIAVIPIVVPAEVRATYTVVGRAKDFALPGRIKDFTVVGRVRDFVVG